MTAPVIGLGGRCFFEMIKAAFVTTLLAAAAALVATAPTAAAADSYCGESSRGPAVYAGNTETSCGFALNTTEVNFSGTAKASGENGGD